MAKRKRRAFRTKAISLSYVETQTEQQNKFPKKLVAAFVNLDKTKKFNSNTNYYEWREKAYKLYEVEAKKYLGSLNDRIKSGRLIVKLSKATWELHNEQTKAKKE